MIETYEDGATTPHVLYRFYDKQGQLLYIGMTSSFGRRMNQHRSETPWIGEVARCAKEYLLTRFDLQNAEKVAIQTEKSKYNIVNAPPPAQPKQAPGRRIGRDANNFGRTDSIACDMPPPGRREECIVKLERYLTVPLTLLDDRCPSCFSVYMISHDDLYKCLHCFTSWTPEEFSSNLETKEIS